MFSTIVRLRAARLAVTVGALIAPGRAQAQNLDPNAWTKADFVVELEVPDPNGGRGIPLKATDAERFFNRANCECNQPIQVVIELSPSGKAKAATVTSGEIRLFAADIACVATTIPARPPQAECDKGRLGDATFVSLARQGRIAITTTADKFFALAAGTASDFCAVEREQFLVLWVDRGMDGNPDLSDPPVKSIQLRGKLPPIPREVRVTGGNESLEVRWKAPEDFPELDGFAVFCARGGQFAPFNPSHYESEDYETKETVCGIGAATSQPVITFQTSSDSDDGQLVSAPDPLRRRDSAFVCADRLSSSTTSVRITGLENGVPYAVAVAAVDKRRNIGAIEDAIVQKPISTRDFYLGYRDAGGSAEGGYCAIGRRPERIRAGVIGGVVLAVGALAVRAGKRGGRCSRRRS